MMYLVLKGLVSRARPSVRARRLVSLSRDVGLGCIPIAEAKHRWAMFVAALPHEQGELLPGWRVFGEGHLVNLGDGSGVWFSPKIRVSGDKFTRQSELVGFMRDAGRAAGFSIFDDDQEGLESYGPDIFDEETAIVSDDNCSFLRVDLGPRTAMKAWFPVNLQ